LKHVGFIDSQSPRRTSQTFPRSPSTCDESIAVAVAVAVKDHAHVNDNVNVDVDGWDLR
jgi:hypothetical protein